MMMAQSTTASPPFFFFLFSRAPKPSHLVSSSSAPSVLLSVRPSPFPSLQSSKAKRNDDAFSAGKAYQRLEEEIFEFMRGSKKPEVFPTRDELIEAGRRDLADAVVKQGGWLSFGWDLGSGKGNSGGSGGGSEALVGSSAAGDGNKAADWSRGVHPDYPEVSVSGRSMDEEEKSDDSVVEGILRRIEKQRNLAKDRKGNSQPSHDKRELDPGEGAFFNYKHHMKINKVNSKPNLLPPKEEAFHDYQIIGSKNGNGSFVNGSVNSSISDKWTGSSIINGNCSGNDIEADKIVAAEERSTLDSDTQKDSFGNGKLHNSVASSGSKGSKNEQSLEMGDIRQRINQLESSLSSALESVRSRVKKVLSHEIDESSAAMLDNLSDDWEFRETEILKNKDEVRSLRARLSVLEGKMALQIIEAQKLMEENQKKLDEAQRALCGLRNISVVWPNPAFEVLLAGSFDGWTSKRIMEKSKEGIFSLNLMLYPGKYEIKFIVDGVWTVDPLRPVVNHGGHENNLLTVV